MSGTSSGGRASVQIPRDVIMIDSDGPNNNNTSSETETQPPAPVPAQNVPPPPQVTIGEPAEGYSIHQSIIISHNYYEKKILGDGSVRAKCLLCFKEKNKEVLFKMTDGNLRGKNDHCNNLICQSFTD